MESKHFFVKALILLFACSAPSYNVWSQGGLGPTYISTSDAALKDNYITNKRLNPGIFVSQDDYIMHLNKFIPAKHKYATDDFVNAYLVYSSGKRSPLMKLNHNYFLRTMQYIDYKGDTLFLQNMPNIKYVVTEKNVFYCHMTEGYFEVIGGKEYPVKLCTQRDYIVSNRQAITDNVYRDLISTDKMFSIVHVPLDFHRPKEEILFTKKRSVVLIDKQERILKPTKIGFIKAFPEQEDEIKRFVKSESIRFQKIEDLEKLLNYCISIAEPSHN